MKLPRARIVYCSATGTSSPLGITTTTIANYFLTIWLLLLLTYIFIYVGCTKPSDMAYMSRLGLWGPGSPFPDGLDEFILRAKDSVG